VLGDGGEELQVEGIDPVVERATRWRHDDPSGMPKDIS
jgi:hypothetical protein